MVPQAGAVTPVGQVTAQVAVWSLDPVTKTLNAWVVFVITLAVAGEIAMAMDVAVLLLPQPTAPSPSARVKIEQSFHRLMPVLPRKLDIRSTIGPRLVSVSKSARHPTFIPKRSERPAHCEPERAYGIEKIRPLRVFEQVDKPTSTVRSPVYNL